MTKVLYPGSFDPITNGHMNIVEQGINLFDEVIIAIMPNPKKTSLFTSEERLEIIKEIYKDNNKVKVIIATGASIDIADKYDCKAIIRGLRSLSDFEYEVQLAKINKELSNNKINTICLFADTNLEAISSSAIKEIFDLNKSISKYVHPIIEEKMLQKKTSH